MNKKNPTLLSVTKVCSLIAVLGFIILILPFVSMREELIFTILILSAGASVIALISAMLLLMRGADQKFFLISAVIVHLLLLVFFATAVIFVGLILPDAINETLNGG